MHFFAFGCNTFIYIFCFDYSYYQTQQHATIFLDALRSRSAIYKQSVSSWTKENIASLKNVLTSLSIADISEISPAQFDVSFWRDAADWPKDKLEALADKAKDKFGDVQDWTKEQMNELGSMIAGLKGSEWYVCINALYLLFFRTATFRHFTLDVCFLCKKRPSLNIKLLWEMDDEKFVSIDWTLNPNAFKALIPRLGASDSFSVVKAQGLALLMKSSKVTHTTTTTTTTHQQQQQQPA